MTKVEQRRIVEQFTSAELRQVLHYDQGMGLLKPEEQHQWKTMAYGVLLERRKHRPNRWCVPLTLCIGPVLCDRS